MNTWQPLLQKLLAFKQEFGHWDVPHPWPQDPTLSQWVVNVRQAKNQLPSELKQALDAAGFDFTPPDNWQHYYQQLIHFFQQHGHVVVTAHHLGHYTLYKWITQQRQVRSLLTALQVQLLEQVGFVWEQTCLREWQWEKKYQQLQDFYQQYGHTNVPVNFPANKSLGKWVNAQRSQEKTITPQRRAKLEAIGFLWANQISTQAWQEKFTQLRLYAEQHKTFIISATNKELYSLQLWANRQRRYKDKLSPEKIKQLDQIGFPWQEDIQKKANEKWDTFFNRLKAFHEQYGHTNIPNRWQGNEQLSNWIYYQRQFSANLSCEQYSRLEQLGFWQQEFVGETLQRWKEYYLALQAFYNKYGHTRVPDSKAEYSSLSDWVCRQRSNHKKGKLSAKKQQLLKALDFEWQDEVAQKTEQKWEQMYSRLQAFVQKYGHCKVPLDWSEDKQLATWILMQQHIEERMAPHRKEKLNQLGFFWFGQKQEQQWNERFAELEEFKKRFGHCRVSQKWENQPLANWVHTQRKLLNAGRLLPERKEKLLAIGFTDQPVTMHKSQLTLPSQAPEG